MCDSNLGMLRVKTSKNLSLPLLCWSLWNPSLCVLKLNIGTSMTMLNGIVKSSCIIQRILHSHLIDISTILQQKFTVSVSLCSPAWTIAPLPWSTTSWSSNYWAIGIFPNSAAKSENLVIELVKEECCISVVEDENGRFQCPNILLEINNATFSLIWNISSQELINRTGRKKQWAGEEG